MMDKCLHCGRDTADFSFRVLEIRTLRIRDFQGERWVQALGSERTWHICADCAQARYAQSSRRYPPLAVLGPFFLLAVLGIGFTLMVHSSIPGVNLLGPVMAFAGAAGCFDRLRAAAAQHRRFANLPEEEALEQAAWLVLVESAPKKEGDNDLSYLPITPRTCSLDVSALCAEYGLLKSIAEQALQIMKSSEGPDSADSQQEP